MRKYISFISHILLRKASLWVIAVIYAAALAAFSILVPLLANMPAIYPWINDTKLVLTVAVMIAAIFSAMIAVYIFREPQEDGTELLICSKPIQRGQLILAKLIVYIIFLLFFSIIPVAIFLIMFAFPQFNIESVGWLMIGFICGNVVSMLFFGSIAALLSLKFNKIVVIVANMAIVIIIGIYNTVVIATAPSPLGQMLQQKKYAASVVPYIDQNNKPRSASYFLPTSTDIASIMKVASLEGQKEIWDTAVANSPIDVLDGFNFISQLSRVYWSGQLEEVWFNSTSSMGIGISSDMHYSVTDNVNRAGQDYVDPDQVDEQGKLVEWKPLVVNDDDPNWTNLGKTDSPATWLDTTKVKRSDTYSFVTINKDPEFDSELAPEITAILALVYLLTPLISLDVEYNVMSADTSSIYAEGNSKYLYDVSRTQAVDTYTVEAFYNGQQVTLARQQLVWQNLLPTANEIDLFNKILYDILFTTKYLTESDNLNIFDNNITDDAWKINLNASSTNLSYPITNEVLFNYFDKNRNYLEINSAHDFGMEIAKFRYYAYLKLTGQAGKIINQTYESGTEDYEVNNFLTDDDKKIIVPWDAYFKCVYYPQFNALNAANMSEFRDDDTVIEELGLSIKDIVSQVVGQGFVPINNFADADGSKYNWLNNALAKDIYHPDKGDNWKDYGINRLTPTYNGTKYGHESDQVIPGKIGKDGYADVDENIFYAYDFTVDPSKQTKWTDYPTISSSTVSSYNKYGYISRLGLMASQFLTNYVFSNYNQVYYGDTKESANWIEEYKSQMYASQTPYLVFTWMLFNYDSTPIMAPGIYAAIYIAVSFIFFGIAYVKFVKYDFK